ncbi:hypothetical protein ZHAS_00017525 [Anopheles sinensis]|uniref:PHD-type domain-containing protein n=1 Tax=Anopheles sinensis TaxID=74873 RepID=A0A084WGS8_ANOSI|nr:hypothetical protein ZHAS_00017525 [Anopheles sinensis]
MAPSCPACEEMVVSSEYMCAGFCKSTYHYKCIGLASNLIKELKRPKSQLVWLCHGCRDFKTKGISPLIREIDSRLTDIKNELLTGLKSEIASEIKKHLTDFINTTASTTTNVVFPLADQNTRITTDRNTPLNAPKPLRPQLRLKLYQHQ